MRNLLFLLVALVTLTPARAQLKSQVEQESRISSGMMRSDGEGSLLFGWFDPSRFHMRHVISMSYHSFGGQGLSLGTYTNMMSYQFSDNLNAQADVSLSYSPYNSFSPSGKKNDFSSIYLSRAQINYRPWDNVMLQVQYRAIPYGYYYSPFSSPFYGGSPWMYEPGF